MDARVVDAFGPEGRWLSPCAPELSPLAPDADDRVRFRELILLEMRERVLVVLSVYRQFILHPHTSCSDRSHNKERTSRYSRPRE